MSRKARQGVGAGQQPGFVGHQPHAPGQVVGALEREIERRTQELVTRWLGS